MGLLLLVRSSAGGRFPDSAAWPCRWQRRKMDPGFIFLDTQRIPRKLALPGYSPFKAPSAQRSPPVTTASRGLRLPAMTRIRTSPPFGKTGPEFVSRHQASQNVCTSPNRGIRPQDRVCGYGSTRWIPAGFTRLCRDVKTRTTVLLTTA